MCRSLCGVELQYRQGLELLRYSSNAEHAPAYPRGTGGCHHSPASLSARLHEKMDAMSGCPGQLTSVATQDNCRRTHDRHLAAAVVTTASSGVRKAALVKTPDAPYALGCHAGAAFVRVLLASCLRQTPLQVYRCTHNHCDRLGPPISAWPAGQLTPLRGSAQPGHAAANRDSAHMAQVTGDTFEMASGRQKPQVSAGALPK